MQCFAYCLGFGKTDTRGISFFALYELNDFCLSLMTVENWIILEKNAALFTTTLFHAVENEGMTVKYANNCLIICSRHCLWCWHMWAQHGVWIKHMTMASCQTFQIFTCGSVICHRRNVTTSLTQSSLRDKTCDFCWTARRFPRVTWRHHVMTSAALRRPSWTDTERSDRREAGGLFF